MTVAEPPKRAAIRTAPEGLPELTLGWQILGWSREYLLQPDGPNAGEPWVFTDEQARFVLWLYAIDQRGRFVYPYAMLRRMKGWGKDPMAAALCCVEFVGPCRFGGFNRSGEPVGVRHPAAWVQVAAVSREQTRNTMTLFPGMLSQKARDEFGIELNKEIIYAEKGKHRIEAVTSSPRALEGGRATFVIKNETHHWVPTNEGLDMAAVIARNAAKSRDGSSRVLAISNAHAPGEGSDAERDFEAHALDPDSFLYDSLEAPEVDLKDPVALREALEIARGDSYWLDVDRLIEEIHLPMSEETTSRRYYLNQIAASSDKAFDYGQWRSLARVGYTVAPGAKIALGFDGSINDDWTPLIGTELTSGYQWPLGIWKPERGADGVWRIDVASVMAAIHGAFETYDVCLLAMDPYYWTEQRDALMGRYNQPGNIRVRDFNTTNLKETARALLAYKTAMKEGLISHPDDPDFNFGIQNAYKQPLVFVDDNGDPMWAVRKESPKSQLKIDTAMAGMISWWARGIAIAAGALDSPPNPYEEHGLRRL